MNIQITKQFNGALHKAEEASRRAKNVEAFKALLLLGDVLKDKVPTKDIVAQLRQGRR